MNYEQNYNINSSETKLLDAFFLRKIRDPTQFGLHLDTLQELTNLQKKCNIWKSKKIQKNH